MRTGGVYPRRSNGVDENWPSGAMAHWLAEGRIWRGVELATGLDLDRQSPPSSATKVLGGLVEISAAECDVSIPNRLDEC